MNVVQENKWVALACLIHNVLIHYNLQYMNCVRENKLSKHGTEHSLVYNELPYLGLP